MSPEHVVHFMHQARSGGGWNEFADAFRHGPQHFFERAANEVTNKNSDLRAKIVPAVVSAVDKVAPVLNAIAPGVGSAITSGADKLGQLNAMGGARLRLMGRATSAMAGSGRRYKPTKHHRKRGSGHNAARNAVMAAALRTVTAQRRGTSKGMVRTKGKHAPLSYAADYIAPRKTHKKKRKGKKVGKKLAAALKTVPKTFRHLYKNIAPMVGC
jgi:hypothetical protein